MGVPEVTDAATRYPVHMWVDAEDEENIKLRVEDNGGMNKKITTKVGAFLPQGEASVIFAAGYSIHSQSTHR